MTISDFTVIGGGITGLLTARALACAGASVTVIEQSGLGQESSWAGGGILLPLYPWRQADAITQLVKQSLRLYPSLTTELHADTGLDPEWTPCGMLLTQNPDVDVAIDWCRANHMAYENAGPEFFVGLNVRPEHALWLPEIAQARNPRLLKALIQDLVNKGVTLIEDSRLTAMHMNGQRIDNIETTSGRHAVNELIIATGAWTGLLLQKLFVGGLNNVPQIVPIKGQMLLFGAEPDTLPFIVVSGDHYLIPRRDGSILVGSTVETSGFDKAVTADALDTLRTFALDLLPALRHYPLLQHWAGLRPGTQSGIPYIGRHPDIDNLSINAGHFRNGLVMGPAAAQLLTDILLRRPTAISATPYQFSSPH